MSARRVCRLLFSSLILLAEIGAAAAQTWKKHVYAEDGFEVEFSGDIKSAPTPSGGEFNPDGTLVRSTNYREEGALYVYAVTASLYRADVDISKLEDAIKLTFAGRGRCAMLFRDSALTFASGHARGFRGECLGGSLLLDARFFAKGRWLYHVVATYSPYPFLPNQANARRFIESFKVIGAN